jgi:hypothetical protein
MQQPTKTITDNHKMVQQKPENSLFGQNSIINVNFLVHATCIFGRNDSIILWFIVAFI